MVAPKERSPLPLYYMRATVDAPLDAARRCDNPIHSTTEAVGFLRGFYKGG